MPGGYEAFISYRRGDASGIAKWIRNRLQKYVLPPQVVAMLSPEKQELHRRKPRVYLDRAYEKPHSDFLQEKILPALDASERLIVISTPSVFLTIHDAHGVEEPNWLVQEVAHFFTGQSADQPLRPVDVVIGPKGSIDRFPGRLAERERWDWIDLRAFNGWRAFGFSEALDVGFTKLAAAIYDVPDEALPLMRQEERRRRRNLILGISVVGLCVVAALTVLGSGWWAETKARQAVDFERRLIVARGLIDTGQVSKAVETLAGLAKEDNPEHAMEAQQALAAWTEHLATASEQFKTIPEQTVFRWQGRNYLKGAGDLRLSFDGPPTLESAIAGKGNWLVTFDADRKLRIRDLAHPGAPLLETGELDSTTGTISEVFGGRLLLFEASMLGLQSDEDAQDAQDVGGSFIVLLDPAAGTYAIETNLADDRKIEVTCEQLRISGGEIDLFPDDRKVPSGGRLAVSLSSDGTFRWNLSETEDNTSTPVADQNAAANSAPTACAPKPLADLPPLNRLQFPFPIQETKLWSATGTIPEPAAGMDLCPTETDEEGARAASAPTNCYDAKHATSANPDSNDTLSTILREVEFTPEVKDLGGAKRLAITAVLGNQSYGVAYCEINQDRSLGKCLVTTPTARSGTAFALDNRLLVINGPEVHTNMFQLIDMQSLRYFKVNPPPMEQLADIAFSPDGARMAALTSMGEVWLYSVDRENDTATAITRYDFGGSAGAVEPAKTTSGDADSSTTVAPSPDLFSTVSFIGRGRLLLAGRRGGVALADAASGQTLWARPIPQLLGKGTLRVAANNETGLIVIHDEQSAQLLTLQSGILLTDAVDVVALAKTKEEPGKTYLSDQIDVQFTAASKPQLTYHYVIVELNDHWGGGIPTWTDIVQRTGIDQAGHTVPLAELLRQKQ